MTYFLISSSFAFFHLHSSLPIEVTDSKFANCNSLFANRKKDILTHSNVYCTICESIRLMASKSDLFHHQRMGGWWEEEEFGVFHILLQVLNHNALANNTLKDKLTAFDCWQSVV